MGSFRNHSTTNNSSDKNARTSVVYAVILDTTASLHRSYKKLARRFAHRVMLFSFCFGVREVTVIKTRYDREHIFTTS